MKRGVVWSVLLALVGVASVSATTFQSTNLQIDGSIGDSIAGRQTSTNYEMVATGGESVAGSASSGSYRLGLGYTSQLEKSLQLNTQPSGLEAYWSLDEDAGTVMYDSSTNNRNGTYNASPPSVAGKVGQGRSIDGSTQGALAQDFDISGTITYSAWFYSTLANQSAKIIAKNSGTSDAQAILGLTSGQLYSLTTVGGTGQFIYGPKPTLNKWYYATTTYDGTATRLYMDGVLRATFATTGAISTNNFSWGIGRNGNTTGSNFSGILDEVKVYSRALSDKEIMAEYRAGLTSVAAAGIAISDVTPGISQTSTFDTIVQTDAPGYSLGINQDHDLTTVGAVTPDKSESYTSASSGSTLTTANTSASGFTTSGTGVAPVAASSSPLHGNYARYVSGTSGSTYQSDTVPGDSKVFGRYYLRFPSLPAGTVTVWAGYSGSTQLPSVTISPSGAINLREGGTSIASSIYQMQANDWVRLEPQWDRPGGITSLRIFYGANVNGTTPNETLSGTASSSQATYSEIRSGILVAIPNVTLEIDELAYSSSDFVGPAGSGQTIPAVSGNITSPLTWSEGSTKGLGFTLYGTNATALPAKWNAGSSYAALPGTSTSFYTRSGYSGGTKDTLNMRLRMDVSNTQPTGTYNNRMTIIGTMTP